MGLKKVDLGSLLNQSFAVQIGLKYFGAGDSLRVFKRLCIDQIQNSLD